MDESEKVTNRQSEFIGSSQQVQVDFQLADARASVSAHWAYKTTWLLSPLEKELLSFISVICNILLVTLYIARCDLQPHHVGLQEGAYACTRTWLYKYKYRNYIYTLETQSAPERVILLGV